MSNTTNTELCLIVRDDASRTVSFTPEATEAREQALATSALIGKVTNAEDNAAAVEAQTALQRILTETEKARKVVKQPVIDMGRAIDDAAKQFTEEVGREIVRVSRLIGDFQSLELAKQRAAERAKQAELDRIEREKAAAMAAVKTHDELNAVQEHFNAVAAVTAEKPAGPPPVLAKGQKVEEALEYIVTDNLKAMIASFTSAVCLTEEELKRIEQEANAAEKLCQRKKSRATTKARPVQSSSSVLPARKPRPA